MDNETPERKLLLENLRCEAEKLAGAKVWHVDSLPMHFASGGEMIVETFRLAPPSAQLVYAWPIDLATDRYAAVLSTAKIDHPRHAISAWSDLHRPSC